MLNPENPNHVRVMDVGKSKFETFRGNLKNAGKTIPQLLGFTLEILNEIDYMAVGEMYSMMAEEAMKEMEGK